MQLHPNFLLCSFGLRGGLRGTFGLLVDGGGGGGGGGGGI
jgi:hypothetical protein